jgi:arylsulfatase A-like enzyme
MENSVKILLMLLLLITNSDGFGMYQKKQPNIVLIVSDDHGYQAIGAYNDWLSPYAPTPNLDQLAREGMLFKNAFVTNSICAPSRATILTGKYAHLNGVPNNTTPFNPDQLTFPKLLAQNGYETALIGKWHLKTDPSGFHYWNILPGQGDYYNPVMDEMGTRKKYNGYVTDIVTDVTLDWLEKQRDKSKPFLLCFQHKAPHRNWMPAPEYLNLYRDKEISMPETYYYDAGKRGTAAQQQKMMISEHMNDCWDLKLCFDLDSSNYENWSNKKWAQVFSEFTPEQRKKWTDAYKTENGEFYEQNPSGKNLDKWKYERYIKDYLRTVASLDKNIGRVMDHLRKEGMEENTIVIYTSDQGFYLGEYGWFDKRFMYDISFKTPLIIRWPGKIIPGSINHDLVMNLDFAPTILEAAGVKIPEEIQGESFLSLLKDNNIPNWRKSVYYHFYECNPNGHNVAPHYGVRTKDYKLIYFYTLNEWELYDLKKDPLEINNIIDKEDYRKVVYLLKDELQELRLKYKVKNDFKLLKDYN